MICVILKLKIEFYIRRRKVDGGEWELLTEFARYPDDVKCSDVFRSVAFLSSGSNSYSQKQEEFALTVNDCHACLKIFAVVRGDGDQDVQFVKDYSYYCYFDANYLTADGDISVDRHALEDEFCAEW